MNFQFIFFANSAEICQKLRYSGFLTKEFKRKIKLNKLEIGSEKTNIIQIASNYKTTDTIILLNLNPITQTYPKTNNVIRFNSLIFVPIRTEVDEEKLEELLTKEIIKTKLLEKLT